MRWNRSFIARVTLPYAVALIILALYGLVTWTGAAVTILVGIGAALWVARTLQQRVGRLTGFSMAVIEEREPPDLLPQPDAFGGLERNLADMGQILRARLESVRDEKTKLQAVLSGMVEGVVVIDRDGRIQMTNQRAEVIFGVTITNGLVGRLLNNVSRDPELREFVRSLSPLHSDEPARREITLKRGDRTDFYQVTATDIPGRDGDAQLYILVFDDVTEVKLLEATRRDFVANVSHEIRTPLTAVRGYAETLRHSAINDPETAEKFLRVIERHSERLSRLTDDLLALSDLELGRAALQRAPMQLRTAIETALDVVRDKAQTGQVAVDSRIPEGLEPLHADPDRLVQVLVNLVDNAVKYTEPGGAVRVTVRELDGPPEVDGLVLATGPWIEIRVSDSGIGIPSRDLPRLTERFYRVDKARSRALGGTGLGLAIVKHIVQAHEGTLQIESEVGRGTTVSVLLPRMSADTAVDTAVEVAAAS